MAKQICIQAVDEVETYRSFVEKMKGTFFYSTPYAGVIHVLGFIAVCCTPIIGLLEVFSNACRMQELTLMPNKTQQ